MAVDATANLFIADSDNHRLRKVIFPGPTLVLNNVGAADAGSYGVVVSSPFGSITSSVVNLQVLLPPTITIQPVNQWVVVGGTSVMSVSAMAPPPRFPINGVSTVSQFLGKPI